MGYKQRSKDLSSITRAMSDRATYSPGIKPTRYHSSDKEESGYDPTPIPNNEKVYELGLLNEVEITSSENPEPKAFKINLDELPEGKLVKTQTGRIGKAHGD